MNSELIYKYVKCIEKLQDKDYLKAVIKYNVSPVINGKKPAAVITLNDSGRNLKSLWYLYCDELWQDGDIKWKELRLTYNSVILIIYRISLLNRLMKDPEVKNYFTKCGYDALQCVEELLDEIKNRYLKDCPHEIGVLLGIPVKDVEAFVRGEEKPFISTGYWIVYNDVDEALRTFALYDSIREKAIYDIIYSEKLTIDNYQ
jgi:hypothetical protein